MKVTSAILTTMSGKLGGAVASRARGGVKYFRSLVTPSNPRTSQQTAVRNILAGLAAAWVSTLTTGQRAAWEAIAADESSGIDAYVKANTIKLQGGGTRVDAAPDTAAATFTQPTATEIDTEWASNISALTAGDAWNATAGGVIVAYMTAPQSASRLARQGSYQKMGSQVRAGAAITNTNLADAITAALTAKYGADGIAFIGKVMYLKLCTVTSTGKVSVPVEYRLNIVGV